MRNEEFTPEQLKIIERVHKLLSGDAKGRTPEEAAAFTAKAQELLAQYNLDLSLLERASPSSAKASREQRATLGGTHAWQRELWRAVAELNFCMYKQIFTYELDPSGRTQQMGRRAKHSLVGRKVNVAATVAMAGYLQEAIDRARKEKFAGQHVHDARAFAFREGASNQLVLRLRERRQQRVDEEARREMEAARSGVTGQALTVAGVTDQEREANYDFLHGEGAWARYKARQAEWEAERQQRAQDEALVEALHTAWCAAHPEEAAKKEAERKAEQEKEDRYWARRGPGSRGGMGRTRHVDTNAYYAGVDAGKKISLDPQVDAGSQRRIG